MNCTCDGGGALIERVKTTMLQLFFKSTPRSSQNHTALLRAPLTSLIVSNCWFFLFQNQPLSKESVCGRGPDIIAAGRLLPSTE